MLTMSSKALSNDTTIINASVSDLCATTASFRYATITRLNGLDTSTFQYLADVKGDMQSQMNVLNDTLQLMDVMLNLDNINATNACFTYISGMNASFLNVCLDTASMSTACIANVSGTNASF